MKNLEKLLLLGGAYLLLRQTTPSAASAGVVDYYGNGGVSGPPGTTNTAPNAPISNGSAAQAITKDVIASGANNLSVNTNLSLPNILASVAGPGTTYTATGGEKAPFVSYPGSNVGTIMVKEVKAPVPIVPGASISNGVYTTGKYTGQAPTTGGVGQFWTYYDPVKNAARGY